MRNAILALICATATASVACADPIDATFTTAGTSGDWTYSFTFTNHVGDGFYAYMFTLMDPDGAVIGIPPGYAAFSFNPNWDDPEAPDIFFNTGWIDDVGYGFANGLSLSGFVLHDTAAEKKTSFSFLSYADSDDLDYQGPHYNPGWNPAFITTAVAATPAPEAASWAMMVGGFGLIGSAMRIRRRIAFA